LTGAQTDGAKAGFAKTSSVVHHPAERFSQDGLRTVKACGSGIRC
jgi:hypothetical protein